MKDNTKDSRQNVKGQIKRNALGDELFGMEFEMCCSMAMPKNRIFHGDIFFVKD